jgi:hypothetical protein
MNSTGTSLLNRAGLAEHFPGDRGGTAEVARIHLEGRTLKLANGTEVGALTPGNSRTS